jgi:uracil-DNA glycosylase
MQQKQRSAHSLLQSWKKYLPRRTVVMARKKVQGAPDVSVSGCPICGARQRSLLAQGPNGAPIAFVALDSDAFSGATGDLLTKMIEALKLRREQAYVLSARGSDCTECVRTELQAASARAVIAFGSGAARVLVGAELSRGNQALFADVSVHVTHALEHLLADPASKKEAWADLQRAAL